jgi:hypothetical protein
MISNIWPGIISPFSPYVAFFQRESASQGVADNYVRGQTVAEMFSLPTDFPIYLTVVVPSNCVIADYYGYQDTDEIYRYDPTTDSIVAALRLDDLHPDSIALILNNGLICGAGGPGGAGYLGTATPGAGYNREAFAGSGGGAGQTWVKMMGGMAGQGQGDYPVFDEIPGGGWTAVAGGDCEEGAAAGTAGGTRDEYTWIASHTASGAGGPYYDVLPEIDEASDAAYAEAYRRMQFFYSPSGAGLRVDSFEGYWDYSLEGPLMGGVVGSIVMPLGCWPHEEALRVWQEELGHTWSPAIPGYQQASKSWFAAQDGTAAITLGCKTYILNSEADGLLGYIFGGGGGGVGGDRGVGQGLGFDGGDWGDNGGGPNAQGLYGGIAGKAVHKNGNELVWIEGNNGTQVKGDVT